MAAQVWPWDPDDTAGTRAETNGRTPSKQYLMDGDRSEGSEGSEGSSILCHAEVVKEKIRMSSLKPKYDVSKFYKRQGFCQLVATSPKFEYTTLAVISVNALWISIDTDLNGQEVLFEAHPVFQVAEHFFCLYFSFEWSMRFGAFQKKHDGLRDRWFVFDSLLVFLMVAETWIMGVLLIVFGGFSTGGLGNATILRLMRLLRLSRMARMARLLQKMPELLILIKGMASALRSMLYTLVLLFALLVLFGITFRQLTDQTELGQLYFATLFDAMHTLLLDGTLLDNVRPLASVLGQESALHLFLFYVFVLFAALTIMNMLIGVLCEVVSVTAMTEREQIAVSLVKNGFMEVFHKEGLDTQQQISRKEFEAILENPLVTKLLDRVKVDVIALADLTNFIFTKEDTADVCEDDEEQERPLKFEDLTKIILSLRGTNRARLKDIVDLRSFIRGSLQHMEEKAKEYGLSRSRLPSRVLSRTTSESPAPASASRNSSQNPSRSASKDPVVHPRELEVQRTRELEGRRTNELEVPRSWGPEAQRMTWPQVPRSGELEAQPVIGAQVPRELEAQHARRLEAQRTREPEAQRCSSIRTRPSSVCWTRTVRLEGVLAAAHHEVERFVQRLPSRPPSCCGAGASNFSFHTPASSAKEAKLRVLECFSDVSNEQLEDSSSTATVESPITSAACTSTPPPACTEQLRARLVTLERALGDELTALRNTRGG